MITLDLTRRNDRLLRRALYAIAEAGDPYVMAPDHIGLTYEAVDEALEPLQMRDEYGIELRIGDAVTDGTRTGYVAVSDSIERISIRVVWEGVSYSSPVDPASISLVGGG